MIAEARDQILTVAQMRAAEQALIAAGGSVSGLMDIAGRGAAEWVWRIAGGHPVTVLCGPGNNGGDGYVIAETIRRRGGAVAVIVAAEPRTEAAKAARAAYDGEALTPDADRHGDVLVDCLFGSGLSRPLTDYHVAMIARLAASHRHRIAIDLPSGIEADSGALLAQALPRFDLTLALGAWKHAHFLMPAGAIVGTLRLVPIGVNRVAGAACRLSRPALDPPASDAHKYTRGLLGVVGGAMPGAALLAATAAHGAGAGYVRLLGDVAAAPPDLVVDRRPLSDALADARFAALLIGPGLGRDDTAGERLAAVLAVSAPVVLDADALQLLTAAPPPNRPAIATPHAGELAALEKTFGLSGHLAKSDRALALARASAMTIVAKGPDTVIAAPDGRIACFALASSWLSTAGTGDVLAGVIASRLATGATPFDAAWQGVWLHGEAARLSGCAFSASRLAASIPAALAACL